MHLSLNEADTRLQLLECQLAAVSDCSVLADTGAAPSDSAAGDPLPSSTLEAKGTASDSAASDALSASILDAKESASDSAASDRLSASVFEAKDRAFADCAPAANEASSSGSDSHASDADYHEAGKSYSCKLRSCVQQCTWVIPHPFLAHGLLSL